MGSINNTHKYKPYYYCADFLLKGIFSIGKIRYKYTTFLVGTDIKTFSPFFRILRYRFYRNDFIRRGLKVFLIFFDFYVISFYRAICKRTFSSKLSNNLNYSSRRRKYMYNSEKDDDGGKKREIHFHHLSLWIRT